MKKILIVDDQPEQLMAMANVLSSNNEYNLLTASNGDLALSIAQNELPDLIITDWDMPGMNGIELIKKIKENPVTSNVFIIMATGVMMKPEDLDLALSSGATDYIRKPVEKVELIARVRSVLLLSDTMKSLIAQKELEKKMLEEKLAAEKTITELQQERMKQKDKELLLYTVNLTNKCETLQRIKTLLTKESSEIAKSTEQAINEVLVEINSNLAQDYNWEKFSYYFNQVYEDFFKSLSQKFPNLTPNDWKLCAFIRMNLTTKDIAQLLNITIESAETSRIRLRKKLNLTPDINLSQFILSV
jgi:response regulator RpfG family c-di-GMP phosphodiesterase